MSRVLPAILVAVALRAQTVEINPEFRRTDPFGATVPADRGLVAREVLSPSVGRNGFASFHVTVSIPQKESYFLYVASNPLTACRISLYKEHFTRTSEGWIPDRLTEVTQLPDWGTMPDPDDKIEGQTTRSYLLDVWIPPNADVARFRIEVQLKMAEWAIRPLEMRVMAARFADLKAGKTQPLPPIEGGADLPALQVISEYAAHTPLRAASSPATLRDVVRRNAVQDMTLTDPETLEQRALNLLWTNVRLTPRVFGAEWYLRLRDYLYNSFSAR